MWRGIPVVVALAPLLLLSACGSGGSGRLSGAETLRVVAAENFWGDIAAQLGGDHVSVHSILSDPTADPHLYESNPRDALSVSKADLVIENGLGYDDFMARLRHATSNQHRRLVTAAKAMGITRSNANPHIWYDVPRMHLVAEQIEQQLTELDPPNATDYQRNLSSFLASLRPIMATLDTIRMRYPAAAVSYTEPVASYLLTAAGLTVKTPTGFAKAIEDGTDPSPADRAAMTTQLTRHTVRVLLYNSQASTAATKHVQDVARRAGVPVVSTTETLPRAHSYQSWQLQQTTSLLHGLGG
jgi:zinc/manganese transport system substrate-binding protein